MSTIKALGIPKIKVLGLRNTGESGNVKMALSEGDKNDFLPVVKTNDSEDPKNAVISLDDCTESKIEYLNLGNDYDDEWKKYPVANIVIAKNSIARIPLRVKMGYDPIGWQDGDGVLEFKSSNASSKLRFIDNDDTDYDNDEDLYDLKDAEYGDELVMEIDAKALARGTKFSISVYASDDDDGIFTNGNQSKRRGICGKFNVKVVERDVFLYEEVNQLYEENENSLSQHTECIVAADKQIGKLLSNSKDFITNTSTNGANVNTVFDRMLQIQNKNYVSSFKIFERKTFEGGGDYQPEKYSSGKENILYQYLKSEIKGKIGFHVFIFTMLNGYHVLTLVIDNIKPSEPKYKIYDQIQSRKRFLLNEVNKDFLGLTVRNWKGAVEAIKKNNPNAKDCSTRFGFWKIQR